MNGYCIYDDTVYVDCTSIIDIVFVLDASGSVDSDTMKNFTKFIISNFDIGDDKTRIGIISNVTIALSLGTINNTDELHNFIDNISYTDGGNENGTDSALNLLSTAFNTSRTDQGIPRVAIVFTDGQSNDTILTAPAEEADNDTGIIVYSLQIGSEVNTCEYNVSNGSSNYFADELLLPLIATVCKSKFYTCIMYLLYCVTAPAVVDIGNEINVNLEMGEVRLLRYAFPSEGLTLVIDVTQGQIQVYGSFSIPNPTVLTADFSVQFTSGNNYFFVNPQIYFNTNTNSSTNVYISLAGLQESNVFSMNTALSG